jgi:16S rRNA processing protein RimM
VTEELLAVGRITRAHGIHGEVTVHPLSEVPARFAADSTLHLEDGRHLTVETVRPHQQRLLVKFREVGDRTEAEQLRGEVLLVPVSETPPIGEDDRFWVHEIVGVEIVTEDGRSLGRVREVQANPANDIWITDDGALVPAVRDVVVGVDLSAGRVTIRALPGLLDED